MTIRTGITLAEAAQHMDTLDLSALELYRPHPETTGLMLRDHHQLVQVQLVPHSRHRWWRLSFPRTSPPQVWQGPQAGAQRLWAPVSAHFDTDADPWQ